MEEGAFGVSSGLDYPPGAYATTDELADLANEAAKLGGIYHTHVRYALGDRFLDPFREAIEIGRRGEAPAHITHFYHRATFPGTADQMLELVDDATRAGQDVSFDLYPSRVGEHAPPDPHPDLGPRGRPAPDEGAPGRSRRPRPDPRGPRGSAASSSPAAAACATSGSATSAGPRTSSGRAGRSAS